MKLIGPFAQAVTLSGLPMRGSIADEQLEIIENAGILVENGKISSIGDFDEMKKEYPTAKEELISGSKVVLPAFTDAHTHICFGGSRAGDYAMRNAGKSYLEIAEKGGGIWSSVMHTREASEEKLLSDLLERIHYLLSLGISTIEIKSGYGLTIEEEQKMLRVILRAKEQTTATIVSTCLAAHLKPRDFEGDNVEYLNFIARELLPVIKEKGLATRVDIFIEKSAFHAEESKAFLERAKLMGFQLTVHADQFTPGSSRVAVEVGAQSADHLEAMVDDDIEFLARSETVAMALPGASIGLGESFAPVRKLLDAGAIVAIASDWNPGSAPMGNLITQASILAAFQKLSTAEVFSGITFRAAKALGLDDRGILEKGKKADFVVYDTQDFRDILYLQGRLAVESIFINGEKLNL